jgi:hypothetical protein
MVSRRVQPPAAVEGGTGSASGGGGDAEGASDRSMSAAPGCGRPASLGLRRIGPSVS